MATWNRYQLASSGPKRAASQDEYDDRDRLAAMETIRAPDDYAPNDDAQASPQNPATTTADSYVQATPGGDVGSPDAGVNDPGDLLPGIQGQIDNFVADDDPAQGSQYDLAALQEAQAAERAAAQEQMQADRRGALGDLSARMGLGGLGLSGATGAALADTGRKFTRDETLALADLDRKYRDEARGVDSEIYDRGRDTAGDEYRDERDARGDAQGDTDAAWRAKQREIAGWATEEDLDVDLDGDGVIGFPQRGDDGSDAVAQAEDDAQSAADAAAAERAQALDDLQSEVHGDPSADGATSLDPVPTTEGLNVVERDDVPSGAKSAGQVQKEDGMYDVFYTGTGASAVYYFVKVGS